MTKTYMLQVFVNSVSVYSGTPFTVTYTGPSNAVCETGAIVMDTPIQPVIVIAYFGVQT